MAWNITPETKERYRIVGDTGMLIGLITKEVATDRWRLELLMAFDKAHASVNEACAFTRGVEAAMRNFGVNKSGAIKGKMD